MPKTIERRRKLLKILLLSTVYFLTARLGLALDAVSGFATLVWPPAGIALATLFLFGVELWPGLFIGACLANASVGAPVLTAFGIGIGNTSEAIIGCWLLSRADFQPQLRRLKDVLSLTVLAAIISTAICALIGVMSLYASGLIQTPALAKTWIAWWVGDAISVLLIAPLIFAWVTATPSRRFPEITFWRVFEGTALAAWLGILSFVAFYSFPSLGQLRITLEPYMLFPFLIWAALRFEQRGFLSAMLLVLVVAVTSIVSRHPWLVSGGALAILFTHLQLFIGVAVLTGLILTAVFSERMDAARQAQEYLDRLDHIQRAAKVATWEWDVDHDKVIWAGALEQVYGFKPGARQLWMNQIHPDDRGQVEGAIRNTVENKADLNAEFRFCWPDGGYHWLVARGKTVSDDPHAPTRMFGINLDITDKKRAEEALKENEEKYRIIAETASDGIITINEESEILFANRAFTEIFGYQNHELIGKSLTDLMPARFRSAHLTAIKNYLQTGARSLTWQGCELVGLHKNGHELPVDVSIGEYRAGGRQAFTAIVRDITEQKRIKDELIWAKEAAERVSKYKSTFLANMSHEIRTPLGAILGFTELLRNPSLVAAERARYIDIINRNGLNLTRLIDDILDLSKVEAGRLEIEKVSFSLHALLNEVLSLLNLKAQDKGLFLVSNFESTVPEQIVTDPTRLRQILTNIIGNAVKFTDTGGVSVAVRSDAVSGHPETRRISFIVKDTGPGIPAEFHDRLFKSFTQTDSSTTRKFGGTGLGLALSQKLARALGGDVSLGDCDPGIGCIFIVTIKADLPSAQKPAQASQPQASPTARADLKDIRVLLVEDSPDNQLLIQRLLGRHGAKVEIAGNGQEGIEKARTDGFDLVLMDIQMPGLDGIEATKVLRRQGFRKPIIALSAHAMKKDRDLSLRAGCDEHLVKPIDSETLIASIAKFAH